MRVTIWGSGYVGLVTGACLADTGNHVVCVDIDAAKIAGLKQGKIPIYEPGLDALVRSGHESGRLDFSEVPWGEIRGLGLHPPLAPALLALVHDFAGGVNNDTAKLFYAVFLLASLGLDARGRPLDPAAAAAVPRLIPGDSGFCPQDVEYRRVYATNARMRIAFAATALAAMTPLLPSPCAVPAVP